jgi:hypothetical protein
MVIGEKVEPLVPLHLLLPKPSAYPPIDLPDTVTKSAEAIKKPVSKNPKGNLTTNAKGKINAQLISKIARNKPKPSVEPNPIILSEDSDSDIEHFFWPVNTPIGKVYVPNPLMILYQTYPPA